SFRNEDRKGTEKGSGSNAIRVRFLFQQFSWTEAVGTRRCCDMPRRLRCALGGYVYHVLNRSVGRATLFRKPRDYAAFDHEKEPDPFSPLARSWAGASATRCHGAWPGRGASPRIPEPVSG